MYKLCDEYEAIEMQTAKPHIGVHICAVGAAPLQAALMPLKWYLMHL